MESKDYYAKIGSYLKELREKNNLTKSQLAHGICSISYITRIENGDRCPTSVILRQLSRKLGITTELLFRAIESQNSVEVKKFLDQLYIYLDKSDMKTMARLIRENETSLVFESIHDKQIFLTLKHLSFTTRDMCNENLLKEVQSILDMTYVKDSTPNDIEFILMMTKARLLYGLGDRPQGYSYMKSIEKFLHEIDFFHSRAVFPAYYLGLSRASVDMGYFKDASLYINLGIKYSKKYNTLSYLRSFYHFKGMLYDSLENEYEAAVWYNRALSLHEMIKDVNDPLPWVLEKSNDSLFLADHLQTDF